MAIGFRDFIDSRADEKATPALETWKRLLKTWGWVIVIGMLLTIRPTLSGATGSLLMASTTALEIARLRGKVDWLTTWRRRMGLLLLFDLGATLWLINLGTVYLAVILPLILVVDAIYFHYRYEEWRQASVSASRE